MFRGAITPRKVLAYIDRLPSWSAFAEASAQDDEIAEMYAAQDDAEQPAASPLIREWTPERAELVRLNEGIQTLTVMVNSALGGTGDQPKPLPRPETAMDRLKARIDDAAYDYLAQQIEAALQSGSTE